MSKTDRRTYTWEIYEARDGWRWRFIASNGRLIAESGEAYVSMSGADRALFAFMDATRGAPQRIDYRDGDGYTVELAR